MPQDFPNHFDLSINRSNRYSYTHFPCTQSLLRSFTPSLHHSLSRNRPLSEFPQPCGLCILFARQKRFNFAARNRDAAVAQLVEHQLPKLRVAGSNPVCRSTSQTGINLSRVMPVRRFGKPSKQRRLRFHSRNLAHCHRSLLPQRDSFSHLRMSRLYGLPRKSQHDRASGISTAKSPPPGPQLHPRSCRDCGSLLGKHCPERMAAGW